MKNWYFSEEEYQEAMRKQNEEVYHKAVELSASDEPLHCLEKAIKLFYSIEEYKDASLQIKKCEERLKTIKYESTYQKAIDSYKTNQEVTSLREIKEIFISLDDYKDASLWTEKCTQKIKEILIEKNYNDSIRFINENSVFALKKAIRLLSEISGYKDSAHLLNDAQENLAKLEQRKKEEDAERIAVRKAKRKKKARIIFASLATIVMMTIIIWAAIPGCMIHDYKELTCTQAQECKKCGKVKVAPLGHEYSSATCNKLQTCVRCGSTTGKYAEHTWKEATCSTPKKCLVCGIETKEYTEHEFKDATCTEPQRCKCCGKTKGEALGHKWKAETNTTPKMCLRCNSMEPKAMPSDGQVIISTNKSRICSLTINNQTKNCFVKFKDKNNNDIFGFFVKGNSTVTVDVPSGDYYVYFAYGDKWYGPKYLFGSNTECSMDSSLHLFEYNVYYEGGYKHVESSNDTYTLYAVSNGNFTPTQIEIEDF